jgi:hypothetical protein
MAPATAARSLAQAARIAVRQTGSVNGPFLGVVQLQAIARLQAHVAHGSQNAAMSLLRTLPVGVSAPEASVVVASAALSGTPVSLVSMIPASAAVVLDAGVELHAGTSQTKDAPTSTHASDGVFK